MTHWKYHPIMLLLADYFFLSILVDSLSIAFNLSLNYMQQLIPFSLLWVSTRHL